MQHLEVSSAARVLERLCDGEYRSGEGLGAELGITRAAVCRAVQRLREYGLTVEAYPGRGYRLPGGYEPLSLAGLEAAWRQGGGEPGAQLRTLFRPGSTSDEAFEAPHVRAAACFAEAQSGGRGRFARAWTSPLGGIYFSVSCHFTHLIEPPAPLAVAIAVALARTLEEFGAPVSVKWPNDLLLGDSKLGGILTELRGEPQGPCRMVIGVGVNLGVLPGGAEVDGQRAAALPEACHRGRRTTLAGRMAAAVDVTARAFEAEGLAGLLQDWPRYDALGGRWVTLSAPGRVLAGRARGIDSQGRLVIEHSGGQEHFSSGEVRVRAQS